jgi:hypothetical protein
MRIEDRRGLKVGDTALILGEGDLYLAAFHHHAAQAQWHTLNSILRVAGQNVDGVVSEAIAVVEWWRTIESLISLLHLIALRESALAIRRDRKPLTGSHRDDALQRWSVIAKWFSNGRDSAPKATTARVKELRDFRNSVEHASRHAAIETKESRLGNIPAGANLADAMEAMAICVVAADFIRFVVPRQDLMPQVVVPSSKHVFYVGLDELADRVAFPAYTRVVHELDMTTEVSPYPLGRHLRGEAVLGAAVVIKAQPDQSDLMVRNPVDLQSQFEAFAENHPFRPAEDVLALPRYTRAG